MSFLKFGFGSHTQSVAPQPLFGQSNCATTSGHDSSFGHGGLFGGGLFGGHTPAFTLPHFTLPQITLPHVTLPTLGNLFGHHDDDQHDDHHTDDHSDHNDGGTNCDSGSDSTSGSGFPDIPDDTLGVTFSIDLNADGVNDDYIFVEADPNADPTQTTLQDYYNAVSEDLKDSHPGYDPSQVVVKATIYSESGGESYYHFTGDEVPADTSCDDDTSHENDTDGSEGNHGGHHNGWSGWTHGDHSSDDDSSNSDDKGDDNSAQDEDHSDSKFYQFVMAHGGGCDNEDDKEEESSDDKDDDSHDHHFLFL